MRSGEEVAFPSEPSPKAPAKQMLSAWTANAPREARAPDLEVDSLTLSRSNQLSYGSLWSTVAVSPPAWRAREDARRHVPVASQTRLSAKVCPKEPKFSEHLLHQLRNAGKETQTILSSRIWP